MSQQPYPPGMQFPPQPPPPPHRQHPHPQHPQPGPYRPMPGPPPGPPPPGPGGFHPGGPGPYPPAPGHRKPKKGKGVAVVAILVPLVLIAVAAVGGLVYFRGIGPLGPFAGSKVSADRELTAVLQETFADDYKPAEGTGLFKERWWTGKHLVRTMPNQVVAYDLASGKVAWKVDVPANHVCRASGQASAKGYVALLSGTRDDGCRKVTVVDINNGKKLWSKDLPPSDPSRGSKALSMYFPGLGHRPVILGDQVYVPTDNGGHILKAADGSVIQRPNPKSNCHSTHYDAIGQTGFAYRSCSREGKDDSLHLVGFNAAGKVTWRWDLPVERGKTYKLVGVLSADPLLVRVYGEQRQEQIWQVEPGSADDGGGKHRLVVDLTGDTSKLSLHEPVPSDPCQVASGDGLNDCSRHLVSKGALYLQHGIGDQSKEHRKGLAAYNIATGKRQWLTEWDAAHNIEARMGEEYNVTAPLGVDKAGRPIVYLPAPTEEDSAALLSVDWRDGKMTPIATLPPPNQAMARLGQPTIVERPEPGSVEWHNGYLAFFQTQAGAREAGYGATIVYK